MRGGEETTKKQPSHPSCCTRPAFALSGADMLWQSIGWVRIEIWPQIVRGEFVFSKLTYWNYLLCRHLCFQIFLHRLVCHTDCSRKRSHAEVVNNSLEG